MFLQEMMAMQDNSKMQDSFTSLELVTLINRFRKEEGGRKELLHKDFMKVIRDEFEEEINEGKISPVEYQDKKGEKRPMFDLSLEQSRQVLVRESKYVRRAVIAYIRKLEEKVKELQNDEQRKAKILLQIYNGGVSAIDAAKELSAIENKELTKEVEYKEGVIIGLVDDIDLATKRQRLNQIMRRGKDYRDRWSLLYQEFEKKYHINLSKRVESCDIKPKVKNKLDYIDRVMNKVDALYELACKVFENDVEKLKQEWFDVVSQNKNVYLPA